MESKMAHDSTTSKTLITDYQSIEIIKTKAGCPNIPYKIVASQSSILNSWRIEIPTQTIDQCAAGLLKKPKLL